MVRFNLLFIIPLYITKSLLSLFFRYFSRSQKPAKHLISVDFLLHAGLGNLMFKYASMFAIAKENNLQAVIPKSAKLNQFFNLTCLLDWNNYFNRGFLPFLEQCAAKYDPATKKLPKENVILCGYYQSWKYFSKYEADLRWEFFFKNDIRRNAQILFRESLKKWHPNLPSVLVGIHVCRGDILKMETIKFGLRPTTKSYLDKAKSYFRNRYVSCGFIVCSNDQKWSKANIESSDVVFVESNNAAIDMCVLTLCNHSIITVGSYGWWSAYLTGGEVVYYKDWQHPNSQFANQTRNEDYFPPHWIGMV